MNTPAPAASLPAKCQEAAESLRGLAGVIRKHGTCAPAALEHVANELKSALASPAGEGASSAPEGEVVAWRGIDNLPDDERMVLAKCDDGRAMVWRASILARNLRGPTLEHLQFPATKWMPIPGDAAMLAAAPEPVRVDAKALAQEWLKYASDLRGDGCYSCCAGTYEHCAAHLQALIEKCPHPGCKFTDGKPCAYAHCPNTKAAQA